MHSTAAVTLIHSLVLSWDILLEALLEGEFAQKNGDDEEGPMSAHLVSFMHLFAQHINRPFLSLCMGCLPIHVEACSWIQIYSLFRFVLLVYPLAPTL